MSFLANIGSMFSQSAFQAVAAGLLTGAVVGSTVVASGILSAEPQREEPKFVALLACPGGGPELARVPAGQELLITARSEDGTWLEVYVGQPGVTYAWAPAPALRAASALDALPVSECDTSQTFLPTLGPPETTGVPSTGVPATVVPTPGPTIPGVSASAAPPATPTPRPSGTPKPTASKTATPSKTPTSPPPTPTPTPVPPTPTPEPPNNAPSIFNLSRDRPCVDNGPTASQTIVTVFASDPDPGDTLTVRLRLGRIYQGNQYYRLGSFLMTHVGGGQYNYTIFVSDLQAYGFNSAVADSEITFDVTARDNHGVDSPTLKSHDTFNAQVSYQSASGCFIG